MKTHILQLEASDDLISVRDKMGWSKSGRILLIWPEHGRVLYRRLDLVILQRHSRSLGAKLALVTRDPDVRYYAPRLGIPVYKSLRKAQSSHWKVARRFRKAQVEMEVMQSTEEIGQQEEQPLLQPPRKPIPDRPEPAVPQPSPIARLAFFTLGVLALLAIAATLLPSAVVKLTPVVRTQNISVNLTVDPQESSFSISGLIAARPITVTVEGRDSQQTSGSLRLPDQPASGQIQLTNLTDKPVSVPAGTIVRGLGMDAILFAVTRDGEVSAGPGQTLTLPVRALLPGSQGNLPAQSLVAIEGVLGTRLSATNPEPTLHGTDRLEPAPNEDDRLKLSKKLRQSLDQTVLSEVQNKLAEGDILIPSSLHLLNTLDETFQPADLQPADHLDLNLRLEYQAQFVSAVEIRDLAQAVLDANLPPGYLPLDGTMEIENLTAPEIGQGSMVHWTMQAHRQIQAQLQEPEAIKLSLGLDPLQAKNLLESNLPLAAHPQISLFPSWWPRLPFLPFRIAIVNQAAR